MQGGLNLDRSTGRRVCPQLDCRCDDLEAGWTLCQESGAPDTLPRGDFKLAYGRVGNPGVLPYDNVARSLL